MRRVFFPLLLLVMIKPYSWSQNNQLIGLITYQNTGEPVEGVSITPTEGASPTRSNDMGRFTLKFPGKSPGKVVKLILVKNQYQVVGIDPMIVDIALRQEAGEIVRIVMVKKEEYEQREDRYEKSIEKQLAEQKEAIQSLGSRLTENQLSDTERRGLTQQIGVLTEQVETLEKNKEELAKRLAQVDLDQASSFARQALKSFEVGNLEEALSLMDDEKLDDFWNNVAKQEEKVKRARRQGIENYMIKARLLAANGQNDDAYQNYLKAIERDSVHVYNLWELAYFCGERNQQKRAISFYQRAVSYADSESEKADLLNNLGNEFEYNNAYESAESAYKEALEIRKRLAIQQGDKYDVEVARTSLFLALILQQTEREEEALPLFREALQLADQYPQVPLAGQISNFVIRSIGIEKADPALMEWRQKAAMLAKEDRRERGRKSKSQTSVRGRANVGGSI